MKIRPGCLSGGILIDTCRGRVSCTFEDSIKLKNMSKILEIGCSSGETTEELLNLYPLAQIVSIDINSKSLDLARQQCAGYSGRVSFIEGNGYAIDPIPQIAKEQFDLIFIMNNPAFVATQIDAFNLQHMMLGYRNHLENEGLMCISSRSSYLILDKSGRVNKKHISIDHHLDPDRSLTYMSKNSRMTLRTAIQKLWKPPLLDLSAQELARMHAMYSD